MSQQPKLLHITFTNKGGLGKTFVASQLLELALEKDFKIAYGDVDEVRMLRKTFGRDYEPAFAEIGASVNLSENSELADLNDYFDPIVNIFKADYDIGVLDLGANLVQPILTWMKSLRLPKRAANKYNIKFVFTAVTDSDTSNVVEAMNALNSAYDVFGDVAKYTIIQTTLKEEKVSSNGNDLRINSASAGLIKEFEANSGETLDIIKINHLSLPHTGYYMRKKTLTPNEMQRVLEDAEEFFDNGLDLDSMPHVKMMLEDTECFPNGLTEEKAVRELDKLSDWTAETQKSLMATLKWPQPTAETEDKAA